MRNLALPLPLVLADDKDSARLREELRLGAIEPRIAQVLAAGELERRKWLRDRWVTLALAAGGWLVAIIAVLAR